jgi:hypothetical protein
VADVIRHLWPADAHNVSDVRRDVCLQSRLRVLVFKTNHNLLLFGSIYHIRRLRTKKPVGSILLVCDRRIF